MFGRQQDGTFAVPAAAPAPAVESDLDWELRKSVELARLKQEIADRKKNGTAADSPSPAAPAHDAQPVPAATLSNGNHSAANDLAHSGWAAGVRDRAIANLQIYWGVVKWAQDAMPGITKNEIRCFVMNAMISAEKNYGGKR